MANDKIAQKNGNVVKRFRSNSPLTSERMRKVKSSGTKIEERMEKILNEIGIPYVKQPKLSGHPDFGLMEKRVLIFCDSSFWHGRNPDDLSGKNFRRNKDLWVEKLTKTKARDKKVNKELRGQGYKVLRFWDDEILKSPEKVKKKIESSLGKASETQ